MTPVGRMWLRVRFKGFTRRYVDDCEGFTAYGFRHIVATEWLRSNPNGYVIAAAILHDRITTVLKHYAHLKNEDGYVHYEAHFENCWRRAQRGTLEHDPIESIPLKHLSTVVTVLKNHFAVEGNLSQALSAFERTLIVVQERAATARATATVRIEHTAQRSAFVAPSNGSCH